MRGLRLGFRGRPDGSEVVTVNGTSTGVIVRLKSADPEAWEAVAPNGRAVISETRENAARHILGLRAQ